ncbi:MAG: alpha/beta fold hydrolase [Chloroflexi bacterium]|nr:alpha/beta fold hydrolase [Chloroflexota bacterium]
MPTAITPQGALYYAGHVPTTVSYPPLVLVHGAGGSHLDWPPDLRRLAGMRVIALDLPGHGRSPGPGRADTAAYAQDVIALLDALDIPRAIIAGHSMGGAIAQQTALGWPDRVAGLVLIATGSKLPVDPALPQRVIDEREQAVAWITEWAWSADSPVELRALGQQRLLEMPPEVLRGDYLACQAFDVRGRLEQISAPVLVIGASEDRMVRPKFSATLAEQIPGAQLVMIEGAGHMLPLEQPQAVAAAVQAWLGGQTW